MQAIQTSFLSNLKCSNHRNNRTCKSMRNSHSGGCETKRAQNSLAISKPCLCERACVSITMNPIHYTQWIITVQHAQTQHSLPTYYILKSITNASKKTHAHRPWPALIRRWPYVVKMLEGPWQSFVQCNENQYRYFMCSHMLLGASMEKKKVKCEGGYVYVLNRSNQESWWGSAKQNNFLFKETRVRTNSLILIIGAGFNSWY